MGLLSNAVPGSVWLMANGKTARYVKKGCEGTPYSQRQHTLISNDTGTTLYRYDHGGCSETFHESQFNIVAPVSFKYPTNGVRHACKSS